MLSELMVATVKLKRKQREIDQKRKQNKKYKFLSAKQEKTGASKVVGVSSIQKERNRIWDVLVHGLKGKAGGSVPIYRILSLSDKSLITTKRVHRSC